MQNKNERILVFGGYGWAGSSLCDFLQQQGHEIIKISSKECNLSENIDKITNILKKTNPSVVLNCAGRVRSAEISNIDYLETNAPASVSDNPIGPLNVALACQKTGIYLAYIGTGCIYSENPIVNKYTEDDIPNFSGSVYSFTKGMTDQIFHRLWKNSSLLNIRIRMPITPDFDSRGILGKVARFTSMHNIPNSMTVFSDAWPILSELLKKRTTGTINLVNPGIISLPEIRKMMDNIYNSEKKKWVIDNDAKTSISPRSNNELSTDKLLSLGYQLPEIHSSVRDTLYNMKLTGVSIAESIQK